MTDLYRSCGRAPCDRPVGGDVVVCGACATLLATALRTVADLEAELEVTRTRQDRIGPDGPIVTASPTRPLPWSERAALAGDALRGALAWCYQHVAPTPCACLEAPVGPACWDATRNRLEWLPADAGAPVIAAWLLERVDTLLALDDAADLVDEVLDAVHAAERAVDSPPALVYAGPCDHCGADMFGHLERGTVTCDPHRHVDPGCGAVYPAGQRRAWLLEALREHTATAAEIARGVAELAGVKIDRRTVNVWAGRTVAGVPKLLDRRTAQQRDEGADPEYRIGDVLDLAVASAHQREQRAARRRQRAASGTSDDASDASDDTASAQGTTPRAS